MKYVRPKGMRESLPPVPEHMKDLPISENGYPIPFFVATVNGKPDFRVLDPNAIYDCVDLGLCWVCGNKMEGHAVTFVAGPMLAINQMSAEPPMHHECATYAVQSCPFMLYPKAQRRAANLPVESTSDYCPGKMIDSNPGVSVLWTTRGYQVERSNHAMAFTAGAPIKVEWYSEGKPATHQAAETALRNRVVELLDYLGGEKMERQMLRQVQAMVSYAQTTLPKE